MYIHWSFIGFYENGTKLPIAQAATYEFQVGLTDVIRGWSLGVMGMCVGEIRKLTIPAHLAYGEWGAGPLIPGRNEDKSIIIIFIFLQNCFISGGTVLVYDVYLRSVEDGFKDFTTSLTGDDSIEEIGLSGVLMNYLRTHLTKHRRGSFIQNGVRTKT